MIGSMQQQPVLDVMPGSGGGGDLDPDLFEVQHKAQAAGHDDGEGALHSAEGQGEATTGVDGTADLGGETEDGADADEGRKKKRKSKGKSSSSKKKSGSRSKGSKVKEGSGEAEVATTATSKSRVVSSHNGEKEDEGDQTDDEGVGAAPVAVTGDDATSPSTDSAAHAAAAAVLAVTEAQQQQPNYHQLALAQQSAEQQGLVLHFPHMANMPNVNMTPAELLAAYQLQAQQAAQFGYPLQFQHPGLQADQGATGNSTLDSLAAAAIAASLATGGVADPQHHGISMVPFQMMHMQSAEHQQQLQQQYQQQLAQIQQAAANAPTSGNPADADPNATGGASANGGTKKPRLRTFKYTAPHGEGETFHMGPRDTTCCVQCKQLGIGGEKICDHDMKRVFCKQCKALGIGGHHICEHDKKRDECRTCKALGVGGGKICDHDKWKDKCRECRALGIGGNSFCQHEKRRDDCKECKALGIGGGNICDHGKMRYKCQTCKSLGVGGRGLCPHNLKRTACFQCIAMGFGSGYPMCEHNAKRAKCRQCKALGTGGEAICDHNKVRVLCKECKKPGQKADDDGGSSSSGVPISVDLATVCEHGLIKGNCPTCLANLANQAGEETEDEQPEMDVSLFLRPTAKRKHKLLRSESHPIKRTRVCPHGYLKRDCSDCNATNLAAGVAHVCEHGMIRTVCPTCLSNPAAYQPPPPPPPSFDLKAMGAHGFHRGDDEDDDDAHDAIEAAAAAVTSAVANAAHNAGHHDNSNGQSLSLAAPPGSRCEHDRQRNFCADCLRLGRGGVHVCPHLKPRYQCSECRTHLGWGSGGGEPSGQKSGDMSDGGRLMHAAREMVEAINGGASVGGGHVLVTGVDGGASGGADVCVHGKAAECEDCAQAVLGMYLNIAGSGVTSAAGTPAAGHSPARKKKETVVALCPHGKGQGRRCRDCVMEKRSNQDLQGAE
ncbi:hypothetical protein HK101_001946 [Irineochytrium annulatum]|nr:hypothetical protein HK101_001946 [Irineochytrium annulatum]